MATNFVQPGNTITLPAPAGGALAGHLVVIGAIVGVAAAPADAGQPVDIVMEGVWDLQAFPGHTFAVGSVAYATYSDGFFLTTNAASKRVGVVIGNPRPEVYRVRLG